ncbi:MAG: DNA-3-methyladenine glycosylase 2 [Ruminococcaceae bacterium]|nr:DNA-3-methyladenine glycosylase 2 [Oscillospiraceae bacterium]
MAQVHQMTDIGAFGNMGSQYTLTYRSDDDFDLDKIFNCGQCFRWSKDSDGSYIGAANGHAARVSKNGNIITVSGTGMPDENHWREYFDMDVVYSEIRKSVSNCEYMQEASDFGAGIRILKQDKWEALCSFIFSQCNNITRITNIIEKFCTLYGRPIAFENGVVYDFPKPETVAGLTSEDLAPLKSGYRAPYVIAAAKEIAEGRMDLEKVSRLPTDEALAELKKLPGVGNKVANCVLLFGLGKREAFPIDVWMKRALQENFPPDFDPAVFGQHGGIAQQYIFYYARSKGTENK